MPINFCDISYHIPLVPLGGWRWWVILVWWAGRQTDFRCDCDNSLRGCLRWKGLCIGRLCGQVGYIDHARREWIFANNELVIMEYHRLYPSRLLHHTPPRCRLCQIAIIQQGDLWTPHFHQPDSHRWTCLRGYRCIDIKAHTYHYPRHILWQQTLTKWVIYNHNRSWWNRQENIALPRQHFPALRKIP